MLWQAHEGHVVPISGRSDMTYVCGVCDTGFVTVDPHDPRGAGWGNGFVLRRERWRERRRRHAEVGTLASTNAR
jgi:hypothetical protein